MSANVENAGASVVASGTVSARPVARLDGQRILIVEDNQFVAHQCQRALTDAGCEVVDIVTSADEAVRVALERRPQLVLMDIYLPGKRDGVDAAIEIFERRGIRSIFASAPADSVVKARAEIARPLAWLPKPFSDKKLLATVESAIVNAEAYPSLLLKSAARDAKNAINIGPKRATLADLKEERPDVLTEVPDLRNPPPALAALASAIDLCPALRKMARCRVAH
jgi:two-component system, response regulator PdtaR